MNGVGILTMGRYTIHVPIYNIKQKSCTLSGLLMDDFLGGGGYTFLNKFLLHLEHRVENPQSVRLLELVEGLVYVGFKPLELPKVSFPYNEDTVPPPQSDTSAGTSEHIIHD